MQHSDQPFIELDRARKAVVGMRKATSLQELDEQWKEFLHRIERVWNKAASHFKKSPRWNGWQGKYLKLRGNDELLCYLVNARGADEHTINEITERTEGGFSLLAGPSGNLHIHSLKTDSFGNISELYVNPGTVAKFDVARVKLLPVRNRGVDYNVPRQHLSQPVDPDNLIDIAERAIKFYDGFLVAADAFFVTAPREHS